MLKIKFDGRDSNWGSRMYQSHCPPTVWPLLLNVEVTLSTVHWTMITWTMKVKKVCKEILTDKSWLSGTTRLTAVLAATTRSRSPSLKANWTSTASTLPSTQREIPRIFRGEQPVSFFKKWANPGLFIIYFRSFQTYIITIFTTNICENMSIQCRVPGFEPTTFGKWVSSHNH